MAPMLRVHGRMSGRSARRPIMRVVRVWCSVPAFGVDAQTRFPIYPAGLWEKPFLPDFHL